MVVGSVDFRQLVGEMNFVPEDDTEAPGAPVHAMCPYCGLDLPALNAMGIMGFGAEGTGVLFGCDCGMSMVIILNPHEYAEFLMDLSTDPMLREVWFDQYGELDEAVMLAESDHQLTVVEVKEKFKPKEPPPREQVEGRLVKGWQVDLDAVVSVADLRLHWDWQEQMEVQSVVRERAL